MIARRARWLVLCLALIACSDGSYSINVRFRDADLQNRATRVDIRVLLSCQSTAPIGGKVITLIKNEANTETLGKLEPGRYAFEATGYERDGPLLCQIARGCVPHTVEAGGSNTILIIMDEIEEPTCMLADSDGGTLDAGDLDAGTGDGGGTCTPTEEVCNDDDDDCDSRVDETTDKEADRQNCGQCGNVCDEGLTCANTFCVPPAVELTAGNRWTCALREDGRIFCWGVNLYGQLGNGTYSERLFPAEVTGITDAVHISAGKFHICALRAGGQVLCWGENGNAQLGPVPGANRSTPSLVEGIDTVTSLGLGYYHSCAVTDDGLALCWGWNGGGQLGRSFVTENDFQRVPAAVPGVTDVVEVDGGWKFTCARHTNGTVSCWGMNEAGQLGDGTTTSRYTPALVEDEDGNPLEDVIAMGVGLDQACVVQSGDKKDEGNVLCWGSSVYGQVGDGIFHTPVSSPVSIGISDGVEVAPGSFFTCARSSDGTVRCWGINDKGQLGNDAFQNANVPTNVFGLSNATRLYVDNGDYHSCAVRADLRVVCWGWNADGQLGIGEEMEEPHRIPVVVRRL